MPRVHSKGKWKGSYPTQTAEIDTEGDFSRDIHVLIDELARPMYVFRLAHARARYLEQKFPGLTGLEHQPQRGQYISATKRLEKATREIDDIVRKYVEETTDANKSN